MSYSSSTRNVTIPKDGTWDMCEHLEEGDVAYKVNREDDSFGPVMRYGMCEACTNEELRELEESTVFCRECKEHKPYGDVMEWMCYDFNTAQGDVPISVCNDCWDSDSHQRRMRNDRMNEEAESEWYD